MPSEVSLFRHQALEHFIQSREKTVLPRITRPPVFLLLWILLSLATIALLVAWFGRIPVYLSGVGIVMEQTMLPNRQAVSPTMALVFVPVAPAHIVTIHVGAPVQLQMGTSEQSYTTAVDGVEPGVLSPDEIRQRYALGSRVSSLITGPSLVVSIKLGSAFASPVYGGSFLTAQIQVGSTSVFSSLFGSTQLGGA